MGPRNQAGLGPETRPRWAPRPGQAGPRDQAAGARSPLSRRAELATRLHSGQAGLWPRQAQTWTLQPNRTRPGDLFSDPTRSWGTGSKYTSGDCGGQITTPAAEQGGADGSRGRPGALQPQGLSHLWNYIYIRASVTVFDWFPLRGPGHGLCVAVTATMSSLKTCRAKQEAATKAPGDTNLALLLAICGTARPVGHVNPGGPHMLL